MKSKHLFLVNFLTLIRLPLSVLIFILLVKKETSLLLPLPFISFVLVSDLFDGKLARKYRVESPFGAHADVFCDAFFILSSCYALYLKELLPSCILFIILFKLLEFVITSKIACHSFPKKRGFHFDFIGRYVAVGFYLLSPTILILKHFTSNLYFEKIRGGILLLLLLASLFSFVLRINRLLQSKNRVTEP